MRQSVYHEDIVSMRCCVCSGKHCFAHVLWEIILQPPFKLMLQSKHILLRLFLEKKASQQIPLPYKRELISFNAFLDINIHKAIHPPPGFISHLKKKDKWICLHIDPVSFSTWFSHCFMNIKASTKNKDKIRLTYSYAPNEAKSQNKGGIIISCLFFQRKAY